MLGDHMGRVMLWSYETDALTVLPGHLANVNAIAVSPDGTRMVTAGLDATIELWDLRTGEPLTSLGRHARDVRTLAFVDDGVCDWKLGAYVAGTVLVGMRFGYLDRLIYNRIAAGQYIQLALLSILTVGLFPVGYLAMYYGGRRLIAKTGGYGRHSRHNLQTCHQDLSNTE